MNMCHSAVRPACYFIAIAFTFLLPVFHAAHAAPAVPAAQELLQLQPVDIDFTASKAFIDGKPDAADPQPGILATLGLRGGEPWTAGTHDQGKTRQYMIVFTRPLQIGSVLLQSGGKLQYLKKDATPAPDKADVWQDVVFPASQSGWRLAALPVGTSTRAILFTADKNSRQWNAWHKFGMLRLLQPRLHNVVPDGLANGEAEYISYADLRPPIPFVASNVTRGKGAWQSHGPDTNKRIPRVPVTDLAPTWFVISWDQPQNVSGILLRSNFKKFKLFSYQGPEGVNPAVAREKDWEKVKFDQRQDGEITWITMPAKATRGLRFVTWDVDGRRYGLIEGLQAFVNIQDGPVPPRASSLREPPYKIPFKIPGDATVSMAIDSADGHRTRNLIMREDRKAGDYEQGWDLKDEQGRFVQPGSYKWKATVNPGLTVSYEMTPYPNVTSNSPENSPWQNGESGSGGWMADHSPPRAACAAGDRIFFSDQCSESGVALIECDLDGRKKWGHGNIIAWTGPAFMASDAKYLYTAPTTGATDYIWRFSLTDRKMDTWLQLNSSATRQRGISGLAVGNGRLFMSVNPSGQSWVDNAAAAADVDADRCEPKYPKPKDRGGKPDDPDYPQDFLRMFRLMGTPPGCNGLTYLETAKEPAPRQHIVLAFNKPVPVGSFVFPLPEEKNLHMRISVLKPDASYPPIAIKEDQWLTVWKGNGSGWLVVPAPEKTITRAVRLSFDHGMDELDELMDKNDDTGADGLNTATDKKAEAAGAWKASLEGMKILRRRFANLFPTCKVTVNSGKVGKDGEWDAGRDRPLTIDNPAIYQMEWETPQTIRGLAIKEIDGRFTEIDAWTGDGKPDMKSATGWEKIASYEQKLRFYYNPDQYHNSNARYIDGYVDFGRDVKTLALRLRVVEQWMWKEEDRSGCVGVRKDRGAQNMDPTRCRIYGIAPLQYVGGESPVDAAGTGRIEAYNLETKKMELEIPLEGAGDLGFGPKGDLYAVSAGKVVRVDLSGGKHQALPLDVKKATAIVSDKAGKLYVFDSAADQRVVKVFDPAGDGKPLRVIGAPGGRIAGAWDPGRFTSKPGIAVDLEIDGRDQLWIVEADYTPKRISCWSLDGTFKKDFLGNTSYGGGGCLDPGDKSRIFYGPMEFTIDWNTGATSIKGITWMGDSPAGEQPISVGDRQYMVTRPMFCRQAVGVVYLYDNGRLKRVAAVGRAGNFPALRTSAILEKFGRKAIGYCSFAWSDLNGDGQPQPEEVQFADINERYGSVGRFEENLAVDAGDARYEVKEILSNGAPVYERKTKTVAGTSLKLNDGNFFVTGEKIASARDARGQTIWTHQAEGWGVHALNSAKPYFPGQVVAQFDVVGHETASGELGEFLVTNSNTGMWNLWTSDGLLAGRIFRDMRGPGAKPWSMLEHQRGLDLSDITTGQEHFSGYFCRSQKDGKYYVVAGHNHVSVAEVQGLDKIKRIGNEIKVGQPELTAAIEWDRQQQARKLYESAKLVVCRRATENIKIDGKFDDWGFDSANLDALDRDVSIALTYDDANLYVCFKARNAGPLKNAGNDWKRLFKTGAAVDLHIGTDPAAPANRQNPVKGDIRIIMTMNNSQPVAVMYQPVCPGASKDEAWETHTMVFRSAFDRVVKVQNIKMAAGSGKDKEELYMLEAAIPLQVLGLTPQEDLSIKFDWGVLVSGPDGNEVMQRLYWANQQTAIVSDEAAEAALRPDLWGTLRFAGAAANSKPTMDTENMIKPKESKKGGDMDDLKLEEE
ncbi:MAG TPA: hypothetical protein DET40_01210 [Lentisphaeria bacterium]|nr:MAG: hypothetical protein A2X45_12670 [Lentisphaerae bacterium GWF2_50_93]HCE42150.1 hypothetical protein [Lentisphaeria bacterium]